MAIDLVPGCGAFTSGTSYEAEATALFARFSSDPGTTRKNAINTCIASLKSAGVWSKLDALWVFAAHDSQASLLNWVSTSHAMGLDGSPTFTADAGYSCTGGGNFLRTTSNVDTFTLFAQNSAHLSMWVTNNVVGACAIRYDTVAGSNIYPRYHGNAAYLRVNDSPETSSIAASTDSSGFWLGNRSSSTAREAYKNGSSIGTYGSVSSVAPPAERMLITGESSTAIDVACASVGSSLTSGEVTSFYNAMNTLKAAIGW